MNVKYALVLLGKTAAEPYTQKGQLLVNGLVAAILMQRRSFRFWYRMFCVNESLVIREICLHAMDRIERTHRQQLAFEDLVKRFGKIVRFRSMIKPPDEGGSSFPNQ
jgi:hypothetical protein